MTTESYIDNMSIALAKRGHNVHIVSFSDKKAGCSLKGYENRIIFHKANFKPPSFRGVDQLENFFPVYSLKFSYTLNRFLQSFIKEHEIDIIESPDWSFAIWAYTQRCTIPVCIRLHGYGVIQEKNKQKTLKGQIKDFIINHFLKDQITKASLVTSVSDAYTDVVKNAYKIRRKDIYKIPIGINTSIFCPETVEKKEWSILIVGRLEEAKGLKVIEKSIPFILKDFPQMKFYFAGPDLKHDHGDETWSQHLIKLYGSETIIYLGQLSMEALVHYYRTATMLVSPSLFEAGGMVAIEAMACACPVVGTRTNGFLEYVKNNENGILVPVGDPQSLAEAIVKILQDKQLKERLTQNAFAYVIDNFDVELTAEKTLQAYSAAINSFKQGRAAWA